MFLVRPWRLSTTYKNYFHQILDIRNGVIPRPKNYDSIYWDYVTASGNKPQEDGEAIALEALMQSNQFSTEEFSTLKQVKKRSDKLALLEDRAMFAVKGLAKNDKGKYTIKIKPDLKLAQSLLHGIEYHRVKSQVMDLIEQVNQMVDIRTAEEVNKLERSGKESKNPKAE